MTDTNAQAPTPKRPVLRALAVGVLLCCLAILGYLGAWQGQKFLKKRVVFSTMEERLDLPTVDVTSARELTDDKDFLHVRLRGGEFLPSRSAMVVRRFHKHRPGNFVYTPYRFGDGTSVLVQRGWVPEGNAAEIAMNGPLPAPDGAVGFVYTPEQRTPDELARKRQADGQFALADMPGIGEADTELLYDALGGEPPPRVNTVVVLSQRFADDWDKQALPEPAWQHITRPYLTPAMHLGYTVTWWGAALVMVWVFWAGWTGRLNPEYRRRRKS